MSGLIISQEGTEIVSPMRQRVERLESIIETMPQAECKIVNYFVPGLYAREMTIPKGVVLTGAIHKTEHLSVISKGTIEFTTDEGVLVVSAPYTFVSKPGAKRAGHAIEETVWTTFHVTDETDLEKLIPLLTYSTADELLGGKANKQLLMSASQSAAIEQGENK